MYLVYVLKEIGRSVCGGRDPETSRFALTVGSVLACAVIAVGIALSVFGFASQVLYPVRGSVVHNGQPVDGGTVIFEPQPGTSASPRTAEISAGKFVLERSCGLRRNVEYRVRVEALRRTGKTFETATEGVASDEYEKVHSSESGGVQPTKFVATRATVDKELAISVRGP